MARVSVFGLGYVGCVSGACLARSGHEVVGVDVNPEKVSMVKAGRAPLVEPGLAELMAQMVRTGRLRATHSTAEAVAESEGALICVGTPGRRNGALDTSALQAVCHDIGRELGHRQTPFTVVVRSTVLPGTTESVVLPALLAGSAHRVPLHVAVNPEFMREGSALRDFARPPLTLVGTSSPGAEGLLRALYADVEAQFVSTRVRTAEMVKYVANAFHALKVCFANEVADVCAALGADGAEVMRIFALDRKLNLSEAYLRPGFAFGGSCLPKDVRALLYAARTADVLPPLLSTILPSNDAQVRGGVEAVLATGARRVGVVGLAFKPGTDDLRESPMVALVEALIGKGCDVRVLDRGVAVARLVGANRSYIEQQIPHIASLLCETPEALLAHADALVIGSASSDAERVLAGARSSQSVVDLTRGAVTGRARPAAAA